MSFTGGYDLCIELGDRELSAQVSAVLVGRELTVGLGGAKRRVTAVTMRSVASEGAEVELVLRCECAEAWNAESVDASEDGDVRCDALVVRGVGVTIVDGSAPGVAEVDCQGAVALRFDVACARSATLELRDDGVEGTLSSASSAGDGALMLRDGDGRVSSVNVLEHVRGMAPLVMETPLRWAAAGEDGELAGLRFVEVEVGTRDGALCLFATALRGSMARRWRREDKTRIGLSGGATAAVAIDAAAVRDLVFRPGAFLSLLPMWLDATMGRGFVAGRGDGERRAKYRAIVGGEVGGIEERMGARMWNALPLRVRAVLKEPEVGWRTVLPPPCGGGGVPMGDAKIARLEMRLGDGVATLEGHAVSASRFAEGRVEFRCDVRLAVKGERLVLERVGQTVVDNQLKPRIGGEVSVLTLGLATRIVKGKIAEAPAMTRAALREAVEGFVAPVMPPGLGAVKDVAICREAIVMSFAR